MSTRPHPLRSDGHSPPYGSGSSSSTRRWGIGAIFAHPADLKRAPPTPIVGHAMRKLALAALVLSILVFFLSSRKEPRHAAAPARPPARMGPAPTHDIAPEAEPVAAVEAQVEAAPSTRTVELPVDPAAPLGDRREAVLEFDPPLRDWADEGELPLGETRF